MDLELAKKHLVVSHNDDDDYITVLCQAAEQHFEDFTGRTLMATGSDITEQGQAVLNPSIQHGLLMLIGHWYNNRELAGEKLTEAPAATYDLWRPYCIYHLGDTQ